jgi:hypothetical protein
LFKLLRPRKSQCATTASTISTASGTSPRPLAPDAKCQPRFSQRRPQIHAPHHIRSVIGAAAISPERLTYAERIQYDGYLRGEEANVAILTLFASDMPLNKIAHQAGYYRQTIRRVVRGERSDVFRRRQSWLDPHLLWLDAQWAAFEHNAYNL